MIEQLEWYLRHGLWKFSVDLIPKNENECVDFKVKPAFRELLLNIASESNQDRLLCEDTLKLWSQSWLALSELQQLPSLESDNLSSTSQLDAARLEIEFKIITYSILDKSNSTHQDLFQELTHLFSQVCHAEKVQLPQQCLSTGAHHFLCTALLQNPVFTNAAVQKLLCLWCSHFNGTDNELQGLYKEVLWHCVQSLETNSSKGIPSPMLLGTLFSIISLLQVTEEKEKSLLEWLCPRLVYLFEADILSRRLAYYAFISRRKPIWLKWLNNIEDEHYDRNIEKRDVGTLERICWRIVDTHGDINVAELFYLSVLLNVHFLEYVLDFCSELLICGVEEPVFNCMSHPVLKKLWPLLIFHSWNRFANREEIFITLNSLIKKYKAVDKDPLFSRMCLMLEGQLRVIEWCKKNRRGKPVNNSDMFTLAKEYSTLEMMHRTTNLSEVDWLQVTQILEYNFSLYKKGIEGADLSTYKWELTTFKGFCILTNAFKAILASLEILTLYKKISRCHETSKKDKPIIPAYYACPAVINNSSSLETSGQYTDDEIVQMAYTEQVTKRLQSIKDMICNLYPLNFRIEILENVFSLLFLRYKDLKEDISSDSAGEEEDVEKSPDKSLVSDKPSLESLEGVLNDENQTKNVNVMSLSSFQLPKMRSLSPQLQTIPLIEAQVCYPVSAVSKSRGSETHELSCNTSSQGTSSSFPTSVDFNPSNVPIRKIPDSMRGRKSLESSPTSSFVSVNQAVIPSSLNSKTSIELDKSDKVELKPSNSNRVRSVSTATSLSGVAGKTGFICNEFLIRDLLHCLKECLIDTSAAYYSSLSQETENASSLPSTVPAESVKQNMVRLSQYVSEAAWRLQLLTDTNFTKKVGIVSGAEFESVSSACPTELVYPADESDSESDEEKDFLESSERSKARKLSLRKSETEKSSESGSQSTTTGGGSASGSSFRKTRRSKAKVHRTMPPPVPTATVNLLLSSPLSLVAQCLVKGDVLQAGQVVKMCSMEDTSIAVEVKFSSAFQNLQHNLKVRSAASESEHKIKFPAFSQQQKQKVDQPMSAFQAIKLAASAGVQSVAFMGDVANFLSVTSLPSVSGVNTVLKEFSHSSKVLRAADNSAALAAIDLALTMGSIHQHSINLLDVALKHCPLLQMPGSSSLVSGNQKSIGVIHFTLQMIDLLKEVNQQTQPEAATNLFPDNIALSKIVTMEQFPLSKNIFIETLSFWNSLKEAVDTFQAVVSQERNDTQEKLPTNIVLLPKQKAIKSPHVAFKELLKASNNLPVGPDFSKKQESKSDITTEKSHYLEQLYMYLKMFTCLILQNIPEEKEQLMPKTYFDILNERPADLIGRLVFEYGVAPSKLEPVANIIKLDLAYNVVCNCCPRIPASGPLYSWKHSSKHWGKIVLNEGMEQWTGSVRHPELAVRRLLTDLIRSLRQGNNCGTLKHEHAVLLAAQPAVKEVLVETQELAAVDLKSLSVGDETLVFYTNMINLMWLHSLLLMETGEGSPYGLLSSCPLERILAQKSVGYNLGVIGFVSLYDIQSSLLPGEFPPNSSLSALFSISQTVRKSVLNALSKSSDPRVLFGLTNGLNNSPKVQVLHIENIDSQLDNNMVEFFNSSVHFSGENTLVIPERLSWYREQVMGNQEPECQTVEPAEEIVSEATDGLAEARENVTSLVDFLRDNTSGQLQSRLINIDHYAKNELEVVVQKQDFEFGITFEYSNIGQVNVNGTERSHANKVSEDIWTSRSIQEPVIKFLERHCWLLSLIVCKIHQDKEADASPTIAHLADSRTHCLEQLLQSRSVHSFKSMCGDRTAVAALQSQPSRGQLWAWLNHLADRNDWPTCFEILCTLPRCQLVLDPKLQSLNDFISFELATRSVSEEYAMPWQYSLHIGDIALQAVCVLSNVHHWPGSGCEAALQVLLNDTSRHLREDIRERLKQMLHEIQIYERILRCCPELDCKVWHGVQSLSKSNPVVIVKNLINVKECKLSLDWAELQNASTRAQCLVDTRFFKLLLDADPLNYSAAAKLLQSVLPIQAVNTCEDLLHQLKSLSSLGFIVNYLLNSCSSVIDSEELLRYQQLSIGIQMLSLMPYKEQAEYRELIHEPRLIVEQLVMITRLDVLERMLDQVRPTLSQLPLSCPMSLSSIDTLLRQYAEKALDFRVIHAQLTPCPTDSDERLLMSLSMGSNCSEDFSMPVNVPSKEEWIPNDAVTECMCCDAVAFSMFNRRHHCRRCGRVICGACSTHRVKVPTYGNVDVRVCDACHYYMQFQDKQQVPGYADVPVRICDDCHNSQSDSSNQPLDETANENQSTSIQNSYNSFSRDSPWRLSLNESHNCMVREEFAYEHAPSVSLCLAILKLHSEQTAYPRFLLDSCDRMLQLLQPVRPGMPNREVDHGLVIRMVRALIVAAKVKYARSGLNTGVAHCDQLLSQADLLSELVRSDCCFLIPGESLNGHALRRLRDRLVEEELWSLAMDVTTKGGLDRTGVWAAWGKAALRSGQWDEARQKFSHCLEKIADAPRPVRDPPLLKEIIHILETSAYAVDNTVLQQAAKIQASKSQEGKSIAVSSPALTVLHTLASLKNISRGKYPQSSAPNNMVIIGPKLDPLFYEECQYYLKTYGSHASILAFYLNHDDLAATLRHVRQQKVDPTIFFEHVYLPCLRRGLITNLHNDLQALDSSLELWKVHLCYSCRHLERLGYLNTLYQLQLYMKDYIRAAMTCIRFYQAGVRNYTDLAANIDHLHVAHNHLEVELSESQWARTGRQERGSVSGSLLPMNLEPRDVDRHITTVSRQIEVTKFLHTCEAEHRAVLELVSEVFSHLSAAGDMKQDCVPTLFGSSAERVQIAVLLILCGKNVEEGFGTSFRIIQDYHLKASQVYSLAGKKLSGDARLADVEQLIRCIKSSGMANTTLICDEVLAVCVRVRAEGPEPGDIEPLVRLIADIGNKVTAYIDCRQLKAAYLLAVKYNRLGDVRRILRESERLGQTVIRGICLKKLSQSSNVPGT